MAVWAVGMAMRVKIAFMAGNGSDLVVEEESVVVVVEEEVVVATCGG